MTLTKSEKERYIRQLPVRYWNQKRLKSKNVFIVGLGGLGSASALYLTAAGVGNLHLCDGDKVERSDFNRQILYTEESVGKPKVEAAKQQLALLNPDIKIETTPEFINSQNVERLTSDCDIIVDGLDNMKSRFIINKQSVKRQIPYVYGAVEGWEGFVGLFCPPHTACLACIFPNDVQKSDAIPVAGFVPGLIGLLQATETIKLSMDIEQTLTGCLLIYNSLTLTFDIVQAEKSPTCPCCSI